MRSIVDISRAAEIAETKVDGSLYVDIRKRFASFDLQLACTVTPGITIVFGPSGAGKTTLLDCIAGLAAPDEGRIAIGERVLFDARKLLPARKRNVGYVFQ